MDRFVLYIPESCRLTPEQLLELCERNAELRIETDTEQNLIVMSPSSSDTGRINSKLIAKLFNWNEILKSGEVYDSSSGFTLPDGSMKSPNVSWISKEHYKKLSEEKRKGFAHICPDFVIELRSPTDNKKTLLAKMDTWMGNGCRLAWLIDPLAMEATIYRSSSEIQTVLITENTVLSGESVLTGFDLSLGEVFEL